MIQRLSHKNEIDLYVFLAECRDYFDEFYITSNKQRYFLRENWKLIRKILKEQEIYGIFDNGLKGVLLILREKGFRPYVKFLSMNTKYNRDLLKYFFWNFMSQEIYCKLKKRNPFSEILKRKIFIQVGDRGQEILLVKKSIKNLRPFVGKDEYIDYKEMYEKRIK